MPDVEELEAVVRIFSEHSVRLFHASRGPDGQWIDYGVCETCRRLGDEERPDLHPARMLAEAGLLASHPRDVPPRTTRGGSALF